MQFKMGNASYYTDGQWRQSGMGGAQYMGECSNNHVKPS